MAANIDDLKETLKETVDAFNAHNMAAVQKHLADNLVVTSIGPRQHSPHAMARTFSAFTLPRNAAQAISDEILEKALFNPIQINFAPPSGPANQATITGAAHWTDDNGTDHISFVFDCVFDSQRGWLFQTVSATS